MPTTLGCTKRCYARGSGNAPEIYQKTKVIRVSDDLFLTPQADSREREN